MKKKSRKFKVFNLLRFVIVLGMIAIFTVGCGDSDIPASDQEDSKEEITKGINNGFNELNNSSSSSDNDNIINANNEFKKAVEEADSAGIESNDEDTARFFYSMTRVAALGASMESDGKEDGLNDAGDVLDAFGFDKTTRKFDDSNDIEVNLDMPDPMLDDSPTAKELQDFLYNIIRPELEGALADLDKVSQAFVKTEEIDSQNIEFDYGDVLYLKSAFKNTLAVILIQYAYNLDADIDYAANNNVTIETFLSDNSDFLSLSNSTQLATAKTYLKGAADDMNAAIDWIVAETDDQSNDFIELSDMSSDEIAEAKEDISDYKNCLDGECTLEGNDTPNDQSDDTVINMTPFFAGINLNDILPTFVGDEATVIPDPTFGDVLVTLEGEVPTQANILD
ncbi:exported hypothetical protein [Candidatus Magnetomoraceae bacterium gMMP-15]